VGSGVQISFPAFIILVVSDVFKMKYTPERYRQMDRALFSDGNERESFFRLLKKYGGTISPEILWEAFRLRKALLISSL